MREEICTHWPVHQDLEDSGPCTKTQITVAHAQRDMHTLARAARPRTQCTVLNDLESSGQGTKTQNTQWHTHQDLEHSGPYTET